MPGPETHEKNCPQCKEYEIEAKLIERFNGLMANEFRKILRDELGTRDEHIKMFLELHWQNLPIRVGKHTIYIAPFAGVVALVILIVDMILK